DIDITTWDPRELGSAVVRTHIEQLPDPEVEAKCGCERRFGDSYLNVHKHHFAVCETHKVYWWGGRNLFSSWQEEHFADWCVNAATLLRDYKRAEGGDDRLDPWNPQTILDELDDGWKTAPPLEPLGDATALS